MKNKLPAVDFCKLLDKFGEKAASETLKDVNEGKIKLKTLQKYLYTDETREEYAERLKKS